MDTNKGQILLCTCWISLYTRQGSLIHLYMIYTFLAFPYDLDCFRPVLPAANLYVLTLGLSVSSLCLKTCDLYLENVFLDAIVLEPSSFYCHQATLFLNFFPTALKIFSISFIHDVLLKYLVGKYMFFILYAWTFSTFTFKSSYFGLLLLV